MNSHSTRASVGITALVLAAALSFSGVLREGGPNAATPAADPSVPPASQAFKAGQPSEGNVQDMTY
jgi:hypothetical protein